MNKKIKQLVKWGLVLIVIAIVLFVLINWNSFVAGFEAGKAALP